MSTVHKNPILRYLDLRDLAPKINQEISQETLEQIALALKPNYFSVNGKTIYLQKEINPNQLKGEEVVLGVDHTSRFGADYQLCFKQKRDLYVFSKFLLNGKDFYSL